MSRMGAPTTSKPNDSAKPGPGTPGAGKPSPAGKSPAPAGKAASSGPKPEQRAEKIRDQVLALDVKRVADWIATLVKTVKASRLYLPNNPQLQRFQSDLEARTWSCLKEIGDIPLTVQQFDFLFENYSVYHNADRNDSLAFRFYADGIRGITIREGLEVGELRSLLEVLKRAIDGPNGQDDVVTLLWERDFRHVEYTYISLDDLTEADSGAAPGDDADDGASVAAGESIPWPVATQDEEIPELSEAPGDAGDAAEADPAIAAERSDDWSAHIQRSRSWERPDGIQFQLSDVEREELEHMIRMEEVRPLQNEVLDIVAAILRHEEDGAGFMDSAVAFQRFIELAIEEGNVTRARELVGRLKEIAAAKSSEGPEFKGIVEKVIREIGRPSFLGQLAPTLNAHPDLDPEALTEFLVQLGSGATPAICDLLGQVNQVRHRRALCEALIEACRHDVEPLLARLGDSRWYVIRNVVYVLGRIAHQGVERALDRALHHEDVRVRKEAVRALGNIESPTARAYLVSAFRDQDAGVRIQAAMTLAERRDDRSAQSIHGAIQAAEFQRRDLKEKQAFYEALGRSGSDALTAKLEPLVTQGNLFKRGDEDERFHAALALAWLGTPKAIAVLDREMKSKRDSVRGAVEKALDTVRKAALAGRTSSIEPEADGGAVETETGAVDAPVGAPTLAAGTVALVAPEPEAPVLSEAEQAFVESTLPDAPDPNAVDLDSGVATAAHPVAADAVIEPFTVPDVPIPYEPLDARPREQVLDEGVLGHPIVSLDMPPADQTPTLIEDEQVPAARAAEDANAPAAKDQEPAPHGGEFVDPFGQALGWDAAHATRPKHRREKGGRR